jgi:hypothetical protein
MHRTARLLAASALMGIALSASPAFADDPNYPPQGPPAGGGGGGVLVPPVVKPPVAKPPAAQPPVSQGGGGVNLPTTGQDIDRQALLGTALGGFGVLLVVAAAARRRPQTAPV